MFEFIVNWLRGDKTLQQKSIAFKKGELVMELNEFSLSILLKKRHLEVMVLEKLDQQILLTERNSFLVDLKKDIQSLHRLDFGKKIEESQLKSEVSYLENILTERFDELDARELKLCAYFRLGFNTKEISVIEGIELNEVRLYKTAIRRKLNIDSKTSLKDFLIFEE
jgi:DNA-binding CsgD family transcriptional regulator